VNIAVADVNDESPKFSKLLYNVTLAEDVVINSTIVTVSANDTDSDKNGEITYRFSTSQPPEIFSMFNSVLTSVSVVNLDMSYNGSHIGKL
jgi:hypothetical protein